MNQYNFYFHMTLHHHGNASKDIHQYISLLINILVPNMKDNFLRLVQNMSSNFYYILLMNLFIFLFFKRDIKYH